VLHLNPHKMAEYYVEDEEHQKRLEKRPEETQNRVLVPELEVAPGDPQYQVSVAQKLSEVAWRDQYRTSLSPFEFFAMNIMVDRRLIRGCPIVIYQLSNPVF